MARKSKSVNVTTEDVMFTVLGALGGLAVNGALNKALASQPADTVEMAGKLIPAAKLIGGGYVASQKKMDRRARFAALGLAGTGGIELGMKLQPKFFSIGSSTNVFELIGNTEEVLELPIAPQAELDTSELFTEESVMGVGEGPMVL